MGVKQLLDLAGRTALVTGGSRGLGLQIAEALGEMGAKVAITARKKDELDSAVLHLKKKDISGTAFVCDIGKREAIEPLFAGQTRSGKTTTAINLALHGFDILAEDRVFVRLDIGTGGGEGTRVFFKFGPSF